MIMLATGYWGMNSCVNNSVTESYLKLALDYGMNVFVVYDVTFCVAVEFTRVLACMLCITCACRCIEESWRTWFCWQKDEPQGSSSIHTRMYCSCAGLENLFSFCRGMFVWAFNPHSSMIIYIIGLNIFRIVSHRDAGTLERCQLTKSCIAQGPGRWPHRVGVTAAHWEINGVDEMDGYWCREEINATRRFVAEWIAVYCFGWHLVVKFSSHLKCAGVPHSACTCTPWVDFCLEWIACMCVYMYLSWIAVLATQ